MEANGRNVNLNTKENQEFATICGCKGSYVAFSQAWILCFRWYQAFPLASTSLLVLAVFFPRMYPFL